MSSECFIRRSAYLCEGHDGEEAEAETEGGIPIEIMGDGAERDKDEEDIEVGCAEIPVEGRAPAGLAFSDEKTHDARAKAGGGVVGGQERRALGGRHESKERG